MTSFPHRPLGALPTDDGVTFRVWAPQTDALTLLLDADETALPMEPSGHGYFERTVDGIAPGARYQYQLDDEGPFPDPASRFQPEGVHGPSMVVDPHAFEWQDADWRPPPRDEWVIYELHIGTFSATGTYAGVQERLDALKALGVTAIELMPVADFPGRWNWGYDPAALYAPSRAYGTPYGLRALVDAAHRAGLAVILDVIYNHLGPDGAYVAAFAPMFTEKHHTPWGPAINLDDTHSEGVRHFFIDNAIHWLREYHVDALRLDATHALKDDSDTHFLAELHDRVHAEVDGPPRALIAEDPRNVDTLVHARSEGGFGLDAVWTDDFHHQVRHMTAGDAHQYFASFAGHRAPELATTIRDGWFYQGQPDHTGAPFGTDPSSVDLDQCVICIQNHDQIGNRPTGNRLTEDISHAVYRAASALLLFAPETPLLFMGQEWAATTPFLFFTDHHDALGEQVRAGRAEEFDHLADFDGAIPDPQAQDTFERSKLQWDERDEGLHRRMLALYQDLLRLRTKLNGAPDVTVHSDYALTLRRGEHVLLVALADEETIPLPDRTEVLFHTELKKYAPQPVSPFVDNGTLETAASGAPIHFPRAAALVAVERAEAPDA